MKKPLILFLVLFALTTALFAAIGVEQVETDVAIAKSPGYAPATPDGITKTTRKRSVKYQVNYTYQVAGATYKIDSKSMDEAAARAAVERPNVQVAYSTRAPSVARLKADYDARDLKESTAGAILGAAGIALLLSLFATLILSWRFGWFSRRA